MFKLKLEINTPGETLLRQTLSRQTTLSRHFFRVELGAITFSR